MISRRLTRRPCAAVFPSSGAIFDLAALEAKVAELAKDIESEIIGTLNRSDTVQEAEDLGKTVVEAFPDSAMAGEYRVLAKEILKICGVKEC